MDQSEKKTGVPNEPMWETRVVGTESLDGKVMRFEHRSQQGFRDLRHRVNFLMLGDLVHHTDVVDALAPIGRTPDEASDALEPLLITTTPTRCSTSAKDLSVTSTDATLIEDPPMNLAEGLPFYSLPLPLLDRRLPILTTRTAFRWS